MADDLDAIERRRESRMFGVRGVLITVAERDALVAEVRRLRVIEDAARAFVEYGNEAVAADHMAAENESAPARFEERLTGAYVASVCRETDLALIEARDEVDRLRAENARLDAICWVLNQHTPTVVDAEFGFRLFGRACEHPSRTGDRCDACGWTPAWEDTDG